MAGENNPFFVKPASALDALMLGDKSFKSARQDQSRRQLGEAFAAGGDMRSAIGQALGAGDIQSATLLATLGKADTTDEIKEYNLSKSQGFAGSFTDWKTGLKLAGSTKINNNVNNGEKAYDKQIGEDYGKRFIEIQKNGSNAAKALPTLGLMEGLVEQPGFYSGALAENLVLPLKRGAAALGYDPNGVASMENFRSLSNKSVVDSLGSLGAGVSNADVGFISATVANLGNTPAGNKQLVQVHKKVEARKQEIAKEARSYAVKNGGRIDAGFDEHIAQWAERNPLFPSAGATQAPGGGNRTAPAQPKQAPDGNFYIPDPQRPGKYLRVTQ